MDTIREVIATLFLAMAYAGGPQWLEKANDVLVENANDPEIDGEAAHILRTLSEQSRDLFTPAERDCAALLAYYDNKAALVLPEADEELERRFFAHYIVPNPGSMDH
jgi:hypothetical protein